MPGDDEAPAALDELSKLRRARDGTPVRRYGRTAHEVVSSPASLPSRLPEALDDQSSSASLLAAMRCRGAVILALLALATAAPASAVPAPVVSYDVRVPTGHRGALVAGRSRIALPPGRHRVEIERSGARVLVAVDLEPVGSLAATPRIIGAATVGRRLATGTALADRLAQRLAALHDAAPPGVSVRGTDRRGRLQLSHDWMAASGPARSGARRTATRTRSAPGRSTRRARCAAARPPTPTTSG